jgi:succinoglycan biosynthesis transport protein ExoP
MSLKGFFIILRARFLIAFAILLVAVAAGTALTLKLPKRYLATAAVVLDVKSPDPVYGTLLHAMVMPGYMATQRDIIASDRVARKALRLLELEGDPGGRDEWRASTEGKGRFEAWAANRLQRGLDAKPLRESNVVEITYSSTDPAFAAAAANAFAQAYIEASIDLRVEPAKQYARWFGEQDKALRENLETARARLSEHQRKYGITATDERLDAETTRLNDLSTQLTLAQAQLADARGRQRSGAAGRTLPEVVQNPLIHLLKVEVARQEAKLREVSGNFGKNHPEFRQMETELAALRQRLDAETRLITSGFGTAGAVGRDKEADLVAAIAAQKKRLVEAKQARDQLAALQRDLDLSQKAYESVSQRLTQSRLESEFTQSNVSVLTLATEPAAPSFPNVPMNILLCIFLGTFGGIAAAFVLEMLDRRVRTADDMVEMLQLPMLGRIPRLRRRSRLALPFGSRVQALR